MPGRSRVRHSLASQEAIAQTKKKHADRWFPPEAEEDRQECLSYKMPGWRGAELLRLSNDAGLSPRYSDRLFLPAWRWPARIADQSAVRAGAVEIAPTKSGPCMELLARSIARAQRSWTWCRTGLLRFKRGRSWVRIPSGFSSPVAQWPRAPYVSGRKFPSAVRLRKEGGAVSWMK
jgi:hypothetical protein